MAWRQSLARRARRTLWLGGEPDPRPVQLGFVALLHLALLSEHSLQVGAGEPALWALRLSLVSVVATLVLTPRLRAHGALVRVLAHVDLALIGLATVHGDPGALPLVALPAIWLGSQLRWRSLWWAGLSTAALVMLPAALSDGLAGNLAHLLSLPCIAAVAAASTAAGLEALAEQRRATDAIVETVGVGLVLLDQEGQVRLRNERQTDIDRQKYPDGRGHGLAQHVYDQDGATPLPMLAMPSSVAGRGAEFDDFRIWVGEQPDQRRALSVSARQVYDDRGRRIGAALAYHDVTDLMQALTVKDQFIALVSHELRTPLTSIYGYVSLLEDRDDLPEVAVRQLEVVARNTERMQVLVDDLLDAAQVACGSLRLRRRRADLARLVREAAQSAAVAAEAGGVQLATDLPDTLPMDLDPARIAQVIDNLVSNAIKYTPPGGWARLELHAFADRVEIRVADSGIGIRPDDLGQLFSNFFRTQEAGDRAIRGLGLGLAISRTIVEKHGGRLEVASRPGRGSVFTVMLPLDRDRRRAMKAVG